MISEGITNIVEGKGMRKLRVQHGYDVGPGGKSTCLLIDAMLSGEFDNQVRGNQGTNLMENAMIVFSRFH